MVAVTVTTAPWGPSPVPCHVPATWLTLVTGVAGGKDEHATTTTTTKSLAHERENRRKLPATPGNDRAFAVPRIPLCAGTPARAVAADQRVGRAVVGQGRVGRQLRHDACGQHLAKLHAPLVERVDAPDRALHEDLVLVEGDQCAQRRRAQAVGEDHVRGAVALEGAV